MDIQIDHFSGEPLKDGKINSKCYYIQIKIKDYLNMVDMEDNPYQRNLLKKRLYKKLIEDILIGGIFPPISVVYPDLVNIKQGLEKEKKLKILDGLQRTNCLFLCKRIIEKEERFPFGEKEGVNTIYQDIDFFLNRKITLEVWENLNLKSILYKIVVLNTGQRRMDTRHQLDILFYSLEETLKRKGIEVIRFKEKEDENSEITSKDLYEKNIFPLFSIAESLVSYMNGLPSYSQKDAANFLFETLSLGEDEYNNLLSSIEKDETYSDLYWVLDTLSNKLMEKYNYNILIKYPIFLTGILAAMGYAEGRINKEQFEFKKEKILELFKLQDPFKLEEFQTYYKKFVSGIGVKRRKLVYKTFLNLFMSKYIDEINWREAYEEVEGGSKK